MSTEERAAIYVRMSTPRQEDSPERQRGQCLPYVEGKYRLVRDPAEPGYPYQDLAMRGEDERPGLARLLADARDGKFDVIVCDEWSRLSRVDPLQFLAEVVWPLQRAGVRLDTVKEGVQDWSDLGGVIMAAVHQHKASGESKGISHRVLSASRSRARDGRPAGGGAPFGYRWGYEERILAGGKTKRVPVRLVVDPHPAEVVRTLFGLYAGGGVSVLDLVAFLEERGVEPPRARKRGVRRWSRASVRALLRNATYTGRYVHGRQTAARWSRVDDNGVVVPRERDGKPAGRRTVPVTANPESAWIVSPEPHEAIVSQELFDRVQERLAKNRDRRAGGLPRGYLLSRLLVCQHCGRTLNGYPGKFGPEYRCPGYLQGEEGPCKNAKVRQDRVLDVLVRKLQEAFLNPARLEELRAEIRRQEEAERRPGNLSRLRQEIKELAGKIEEGQGNLAWLTPEERESARRRIAAHKARRDALAAELARAEGERSQVEDLDALVKQAEAALWRLKEASREADPAALRAVLEEVVVKVTVSWRTEPTKSGGRYVRHVPTGGVIYAKGWLADYATGYNVSSNCATGIPLPYSADDLNVA